MATLPAAYIDNVQAIKTSTMMVRGNNVSDCYGNNVCGIHVEEATTAIVKNNKSVRIRSNGGYSKAIEVKDCNTATLLYNAASRAGVGIELTDITSLNVYNATAHNCEISIRSNSAGTFRNISLSAYKDWKLYKNNIGFFASEGVTLDVDYIYHWGLGLFGSGSISSGDNVTNKKILYLDEENDDLTPDFISVLVGTGTPNSIDTEYVDIGGVKSPVRDEQTAEIKYFYDLIDTEFWDSENEQSGEVSFIKSIQSRILAQAEVATSQVRRDYYIKTMDSSLGFSELFPAYSRYQNGSKFKKKIGDLWYATQNPATLESYNTSIGGYHLLPSFFKRLEDWNDGWIIGVSYVDVNNYLVGLEGQRHGIFVDVLGLSTISTSASGECYNNVDEYVSDVAPVKWALHHEVQPDGYLVFTDLWNGYENCTLTNMFYNDDFAISINTPDTDGKVVTPLISTTTLSSSAVPSSGDVEISLLDRIWSEDITRSIYYRTGNSDSSMTSWSQIKNTIGGTFSLNGKYVQFKLDVSGVHRRTDYEFVGLALRNYSIARDTTLPQIASEDEFVYLELEPGAATMDDSDPAETDAGQVFFDNDGSPHYCGWSPIVPHAIANANVQTLRLFMSSESNAYSGIGRLKIEAYTVSEDGHKASTTITDTIDINLSAGSGSVVDYDLTSVINYSSHMLFLKIGRDSDWSGDTLNSKLLYLNGIIF